MEKLGRITPLTPLTTSKDSPMNIQPIDQDLTSDPNSTHADYGPLYDVLHEAGQRAATSKGRERHGNGRAFISQPIFTIQDAVGSGFPLGQALKKIQESQRLSPSYARNELLDSIVYIAAAIIHADSTPAA